MIKHALTILLTMVIGIATAEQSSLSVNEIKIPLTPPGLKNAQMHMEIFNSGKTDRELIAVESSIAKAVEIHEMQTINGRMQMRPLSRVLIPAGEKALFAHGGNHVMLMGLTSDLHIGDVIKAKLIFMNDESIEIEAVVVEPNLLSHK